MGGAEASPSEVLSRPLRVRWLGQVPYGEAFDLQHALFEHGADDWLLLLEHSHVYTMGARTDPANVLIDPSTVGADLVRADRGGDVTYHGPGQLVGYPIVDLAPDREDVRRYVRDLEEAMIRTVAEYGIVAERIDGQSGAWVHSPRPGAGTVKIGAVGVRLSRWVTMHGFALNVTTDLSHFATIVPCGITDKGVTSIERETQQTPTVREVGDRAAAHLAALFDADLVWHEGAPEVPC